MDKSTKYLTVFKAALFAGILSAGINTVWNQIAISLFDIQGLPKGFAIAVIMSSILPVLFASLVYFLLNRFFTRGYLLYMILGIAFMLFSNFPAFETNLPDGTQMPKYFALLVIPMHFVAGLSALYFIPKRTKNANILN